MATSRQLVSPRNLNRDAAAMPRIAALDWPSHCGSAGANFPPSPSPTVRLAGDCGSGLTRGTWRPVALRVVFGARRAGKGLRTRAHTSLGRADCSPLAPMAIQGDCARAPLGVTAFVVARQ